MAALDCLKRHGVDVNILTVVNNVTAQAPLEIYRFLTREVGAEFLQFIPVVEYDAQCGLLPWSVTGEDYGRFMIAIFDEWVRHDVGRVFVQLFDNSLAAWLGERPALCVMQPTCGRGLLSRTAMFTVAITMWMRNTDSVICYSSRWKSWL